MYPRDARETSAQLRHGEQVNKGRDGATKEARVFRVLPASRRIVGTPYTAGSYLSPFG